MTDPSINTNSDRRGKYLISLIAAFKLVKGMMLILIGFGAIHFIHRDVADSVQHYADIFRVDPENHYLNMVLIKSSLVTDRQLEEISLATFLYAGLFLTEGVGLLLRKKWAEYFTVIVTGSFIPLEVYELFHHPSASKVVVILINLAIIVYLVVRLRRNE